MRIKQLDASLVGGLRWEGDAFQLCDLHIVGGRWSDRPARGAPALDLCGAYVLPTLVNAHDHLELNHYPRTRPRERCTNAADWARDVNALLDQPPYCQLRAHSYAAKAHAGLVKNVLSGVHWVIQHGRPHPYLFHPTHPIRVLQRYEWAHSVYLSPPQAIQQAHARADRTRRFFIHAAEGTDARAEREIDLLDELGCLDERTVLIHGVGIPRRTVIEQLRTRGVALVTCATSNVYLLGQLPDLHLWREALAVGTDSRLTGAGDLWDEMRLLLAQFGTEIWADIHHAPQALGLPTPLPFQHGSPATCTVIGQSLRRSDIRWVMLEGHVLWGWPNLLSALNIPFETATLDGAPVALSRPLARWIRRGTLDESGFAFSQPAVRRWW
jgi:hypothetical protein